MAFTTLSFSSFAMWKRSKVFRIRQQTAVSLISAVLTCYCDKQPHDNHLTNNPLCLLHCYCSHHNCFPATITSSYSKEILHYLEWNHLIPVLVEGDGIPGRNNKQRQTKSISFINKKKTISSLIIFKKNLALQMSTKAYNKGKGHVCLKL